MVGSGEEGNLMAVLSLWVRKWGQCIETEGIEGSRGEWEGLRRVTKTLDSKDSKYPDV